MSNFAFSNQHTRCDNPKCKFVKTHFSPCSDKLGYDVQKCENPSCHFGKGHDGPCLYYQKPETQMRQQCNPSSSGYNMQYQSLTNDYGRNTTNSHNNQDRRKFIVNYVTITNNNYYGDSKSSGNFSQQTPVQPLEDVMNKSGFIPQYSNPSNYLVPYNGNCSSGNCNFR